MKMTYGRRLDNWIDLSVPSGVTLCKCGRLFMRVFLRGSQGKPIEARLANHHIKYFAWDSFVSNTKRRRDGGRAGAGAKFMGEW